MGFIPHPIGPGNLKLHAGHALWVVAHDFSLPVGVGDVKSPGTLFF
jgi:hypothetical protein